MNTRGVHQDDSAQAAAWRASIPLKLMLAASDVVTTRQPRAVLAMVPRFGYLPFVAEQVKSLFQHLLPPGEDTPWFEYEGQPLQWQHPAGVLYDLHTQGRERPWTLAVHYRACPTDQLLPWSVSVGQAMFINSLKEAAVICTGNAGRVMNMTSAAQQEMHQGVRTGDGQQVAAACQQLGFEAAGARLPVRILVTPSGDFVGEHQQEIISLPLPACDADGQPLSLLHALHHVLPQYVRDDTEGGQSSPFLQVLVAGTRPSLLLPLAWLHARLHAADQFLYVVVKLE